MVVGLKMMGCLVMMGKEVMGEGSGKDDVNVVQDGAKDDEMNVAKDEMHGEGSDRDEGKDDMDCLSAMAVQLKKKGYRSVGKKDRGLNKSHYFNDNETSGVLRMVELFENIGSGLGMNKVSVREDMELGLCGLSRFCGGQSHCRLEYLYQGLLLSCKLCFLKAAGCGEDPGLDEIQIMSYLLHPLLCQFDHLLLWIHLELPMLQEHHVDALFLKHLQSTLHCLLKCLALLEEIYQAGFLVSQFSKSGGLRK